MLQKLKPDLLDLTRGRPIHTERKCPNKGPPVGLDHDRVQPRPAHFPDPVLLIRLHVPSHILCLPVPILIRNHISQIRVSIALGLFEKSFIDLVERKVIFARFGDLKLEKDVLCFFDFFDFECGIFVSIVEVADLEI